jgi:hypothetical protein
MQKPFWSNRKTQRNSYPPGLLEGDRTPHADTAELTTARSETQPEVEQSTSPTG